MAEHLTTSTRHGAFALVFNARYGYGRRSSTDGPSQRFDRQFWDAYFAENMFSLGACNADSHEDNIYDIHGQCIRWCLYETNLFGDPAVYLRLKGAVELQMRGRSLDDSAGNDDTQANPGETVRVSLTLANVGMETANGVSATIATTDSNVTIVDGTAAFGSISGFGVLKTALDPLVIAVKPTCPTPHEAVFSVRMADAAARIWTAQFSLMVYATHLVSGHIVLDGSPLPGATVHWTGPVSGERAADDAGRFHFGVPEGIYAVSATYPGALATAPCTVTVPPVRTDIGLAFNTAAITGLVTDQLTRQPIVGAVIAYEGPLGGRATTGSDGRYAIRRIFGQTATLQLEAQYGDYFAVAEEVRVPPDRVVDFRMGRADIDLSPTSFAVTANLGQRVSRTLTIANRGGSNLIWDASRYYCRDSSQPGGPTYAWVEIAETGRRVQDFVAPLPDVGLVFPFYGQPFDRVFVHTNGYLSFSEADNTDHAWFQMPPDQRNPRNMLALFAQHLWQHAYGAAYYQVMDADTLVVEYKDYAFSCFDEFPQRLTAEAILKADGSILFQYQRADTRDECLVGIQDGTGTRGEVYSFQDARVRNQSAVWFGHLPRWLNLDPLQGTVPGVSSQSVTLTFDSQYAGVGTHNWEFLIRSNDRDEGEVLVPVAFTVTESANQPPEVVLTAPADRETFEAPASITLAATARDPDGTVARVEFYRGLTKVGEDARAPYTFTWNGVPAGTYTFTARAVDSAGAGWSSTAVTVTVLTERPSCAIVSPTEGSTFTAPAELAIQVLAVDQDGRVERVEFYEGPTRLGESGTDSSGYAFFSWRQVPVGRYTLSARAIDDGGATGFSIPVAVTVNGSSSTVPVFTVQPSDVSKRVGQTAWFTVAATGQPTWQWQERTPGSASFVNIAGATAASLSIASLTLAQDGTRYRCQATNGAGSAVSREATLTVSRDREEETWIPLGEATHTPFALRGVTAIAAGDDHTVALKQDGTVVAWGHVRVGSVAVPNGLSEVIAIAAGGCQTVALRRDGTVVRWGDANDVPAGLSGVTAIAAGRYHVVALKNDGTVVAWGGFYGLEARVPAGLSGVTAIAAGGYHSLALKQDGTVVAWGFGDEGETTVPYGLRNVVSIAAGTYHSLAVRSDGTVVAWGSNAQGQTVAYDLSGIRACAGGDGHSLALRSDGTVVGWGDSTYDQATIPSGLRGVIAIAAGRRHSVALKQDGTVVGWGSNYYHQVAAVDLADMTDIASSGLHHVAVTKYGTVTTWGGNHRVDVPVGLEGVAAVEAGSGVSLITGFSVALKRDGTVTAWGDNRWGATDVPPGLSGVTAIATGCNHTLALKQDGTVLAWGDTGSGEAIVPPDLRNVTAVAAGPVHSLALKADGTVAAWGNSMHGRCDVPADLRGVVAVSAELFMSVALRGDGTVAEWGQIFEPAPTAGVAAIAGTHYYGVFLMRDATVRLAGCLKPALPEGLTGIRAITGSVQEGIAMLRVPRRPTAAITLANATIAYDGLPHALVGTVAGNVVEITSTTYNGSPVPPREVGTYAVEAVIDTMGWTGRATATLTIAPVTNARPTFPVQPVNATVFIGQAATFRVETGGRPVPTVQWQRSDDRGATWRDLPGATALTYVTAPTQASETGAWFRCVATNSAGSATSNTAWLIVHSDAPAAPVFTVQPESVTQCVGDAAMFRVEATGAPTWQWQVSLPRTATFTTIVGATQDTYITRCLTASDSGTRYRCLATNGAGSTTSATATVLVLTSPRRIVMQPLPGPRWWETEPPFTAQPPAEDGQSIIGPRTESALVRPEAPASSN